MKRFNLEYDLDIYAIVAVISLNVIDLRWKIKVWTSFNSKFVFGERAKPRLELPIAKVLKRGGHECFLSRTGE